MQKVANLSILAMFLMYLLTALFGYLTFFGKIRDGPVGRPRAATT